MSAPDKILDAMVAASGTSYRSINDALVAARDAGWGLVPVEPTEEMHAAGYYVFSGSEYQEGNAGLDRLTTFQIYEAMLAAAPKVGEL